MVFRICIRQTHFSQMTRRQAGLATSSTQHSRGGLSLSQKQLFDNTQPLSTSAPVISAANIKRLWPFSSLCDEHCEVSTSVVFIFIDSCAVPLEGSPVCGFVAKAYFYVREVRRVWHLRCNHDLGSELILDYAYISSETVLMIVMQWKCLVLQSKFWNMHRFEDLCAIGPSLFWIFRV